MNKLGKIVLALTVVGSIGFVACGGDDSGTTPDAGSGSGSGSQTAATVDTVSCTGATIAATVTTPNDGFAYSSSPAGASSTDSAISVGGIVEFQPGATHPVGPDAASGTTDSGLVAPESVSTCLKFTAAGTFHYKCTVHGFKGTVTVTQ